MSCRCWQHTLSSWCDWSMSQGLSLCPGSDPSCHQPLAVVCVIPGGMTATCRSDQDQLCCNTHDVGLADAVGVCCLAGRCCSTPPHVLTAKRPHPQVSAKRKAAWQARRTGIGATGRSPGRRTGSTHSIKKLSPLWGWWVRDPSCRDGRSRQDLNPVPLGVSSEVSAPPSTAYPTRSRKTRFCT
jgi:hypothetical protein